MRDREHLVEIFEDTRSTYETDPDLIRSVQLMNMFTTVYPEDPSFQSVPTPTGPAPTISVSPKRTFEAAQRLVEIYGQDRVAVLNFASATNPGGGVTRGAKAQEESLCRCSTLYASLNLKRCWDNYYLYHRNNGDFRYSDACIYSPGVTVFKTDELFCELLPKKDWYSLNVITCAAPNLYYYPFSMSEEELFDLHVRRAPWSWAPSAAVPSGTTPPSWPPPSSGSSQNAAPPSPRSSSPSTASPRNHPRTTSLSPASSAADTSTRQIQQASAFPLVEQGAGIVGVSLGPWLAFRSQIDRPPR